MINLSDYFDAAYVINLPERTDRRRLVIEEIKRINWHAGAEGVEIFPAMQLDDRAGFPSAAVRSCFLSHYSCLKIAYEQSCRAVLIMEDDIAFSPSLQRLSSAFIRHLKCTEWDFVYLGHDETGNIGFANSNTRDLELVAAPPEVKGTHFYCVSHDTLPKLLRHLERISGGQEGDQVFGPMPIDGAFNIFRQKNPELGVFIVSPKLGWQRPSRSDISPGKLDRIRWIRPLLSTGRRMKQKVLRWRA